MCMAKHWNYTLTKSGSSICKFKIANFQTAYPIILWPSGLTPCSLVGGFQHWGVTQCLHLQGWYPPTRLRSVLNQKVSLHSNENLKIVSHVTHTFTSWTPHRLCAVSRDNFLAVLLQSTAAMQMVWTGKGGVTSWIFLVQPELNEILQQQLLHWCLSTAAGEGKKTNYINSSTVVSNNSHIKVCRLLHYEPKMKPFMEAS